MPLFKRKKNKDDDTTVDEKSSREDKKTIKDDKKQDREEKKGDRRDYRLDKISAVTEKALAVAQKRKWLVFLIGIGLIAYFVISSGGFGGMGGIVEKIKSFF